MVEEVVMFFVGFFLLSIYMSYKETATHDLQSYIPWQKGPHQYIKEPSGMTRGVLLRKVLASFLVI